MQIRKLEIDRFRGIKHLQWLPASSIVCLLGPGDSAKTTILDAIELCLGTRRAATFSDADFFNGQPTEPISIIATVGCLPSALLAEDKYGLNLRGWSPTGVLNDEPEAEDEPVLSIAFTIDDSYEPSWTVINDRLVEGRHFPARDRELLGLSRLGAEIDRHFSWSRGSVLNRATEDLSEVNKLVAEAHREARKAIADAPLAKLKEIAVKAQAAATQMGVRVTGVYRPGLEAGGVVVGSSQLSLHQDDIPIRASGLGSRRLNALALQSMSLQQDPSILVDEVESGLEPHRLRHLVTKLRKAAGERGQTILTTHSVIPLQELASNFLYIVRRDQGEVTVRQLGKKLQKTVRGSTEAMLGRRILVCEGKTEVGLCRGMASVWETRHAEIPFAHTGTALTSGNGAEAPEMAERLAHLGFAIGLLRDSDVQLSAVQSERLDALGVVVFAWPDQLSVEERVSLDVEWHTLQEIISLAAADEPDRSVLDLISAGLPANPVLETLSIDSWLSDSVSEEQIRLAFGRVAKKKPWFKRIDKGEALGEAIIVDLLTNEDTPLATTLRAVGDWVYA